MLDLKTIPKGTTFYLSSPAIGVSTLTIADREGDTLFVRRQNSKYIASDDSDTPEVNQHHNMDVKLTIDSSLENRSFLDPEECRADVVRCRVQASRDELLKAHESYLELKKHLEDRIKRELDRHADVVKRFPEKFI